MISRNKIKVSIIFNVLILMCCSLYGQNDTTAKSKNYEWCIEWLAEMKPAILADTIGRYGGKWSAAERLIKDGCDFVGELFPVIENYFGNPDDKLHYQKDRYHSCEKYSFKYILFRPAGTSTTGMKWLIIDSDKDYRITKFWIFTVDE